MRKKAIVRYLWIVVGSMLLSVILNIILLAGNLAEYSEGYQKAAETLYAPSFLTQILMLGIAAPIMEECVFRGVIYKLLTKVCAVSISIIVSALLFGLYHGNLVQGIYGFLCGIFLAWLYEKFKSIKAPILAHMTMNLTILVLTELDAFTWINCYKNVANM